MKYIRFNLKYLTWTFLIFCAVFLLFPEAVQAGKKKKANSTRLVHSTSYGKVSGKKLSQALVWYGIPYGADTSGKNRWKAPKDPIPWAGVRSCTTKRGPAAQYGNGSTAYIGTEDCLFLNLYRPKNTKKNLPVLVYLHGGGNATGTSDKDMSAVAKKCNAIVITVEFRIGAFGYLNHPALQNGTSEENSGNFTLLDIRKALQWVQQNVADFGGNKSNVTLSGFSAGARNVQLCMISPIMKGLFHKVISFSGTQLTSTPEAGELSVNQKLAKILVKRGRYTKKSAALNYINSASEQTLRDLFTSLTTAEIANMYTTPMLRFNKFPQGFTDGTVLPKNGFDVIQTGNYNRVPMILGSNKSEYSRYALFNIWNTLDADSPVSINAVIADGVYYGSKLQTSSYLEDVVENMLKDSGHDPIYGYRFCWGERKNVTNYFYSKYIGAHHGLDVNFLCENYVNTFTYFTDSQFKKKNEKGRRKLTRKMQKYVKNFLHKGNPNGKGLITWKKWKKNASGNILRLDATCRKTVIRRTSCYINKTNVFSRMKKTLSKKRYNLLINGNFANRFFMLGFQDNSEMNMISVLSK